MDSVRTLIVGAGMSGLGTAAFLEDKDLLVLERDAEIGGYCKTVKQDGFVWDYSGHFFHFKHPELEAFLRARMGDQRIRTVEKRSFISYRGAQIDFPFQKNIHQLDKAEFIECLVDLYFAPAQAKVRGETAAKLEENSFKQMLYARFGRGICEKFLVPYNEKLYACDLELLDTDAMGRFFPHADMTDIVRNMRVANNASYNATFTYPEGGAFEYVKAVARDLPASAISVNEPVVRIDLGRKVAHTPNRELRYQTLVSSVPFPALLSLCGHPEASAGWSWNQVLVFNLGFDSKGQRGVHWLYFPERDCPFYRVGFYDNIFDGERMSLYVELGFPKGVRIDPGAELPRVLEGLRRKGVVQGQRLVSSHHVVMDPAYVHITRDSMARWDKLSAELRANGVHSIGRYGRWTYCSIEDNLVEARALAQSLQAPPRS